MGVALADGLPQGRLTVSIGLAAFQGDLTANEVLIRADRAMYDAEEAGKDRFAWYAGETERAPVEEAASASLPVLLN